MSTDQMDPNATTATVPAVPTTANATEIATPVLSKKQRNSIGLQQKQLKELYAKINAQQAKNRRKVRTEVARIAAALGPDDFKNLKEICTYQVPEQKGPDGAIVQKAESRVNFRALIIEGRQAIVLNREARIVAGLRKRSTGRSSDRKAHRSTLNFVNMRTAATLETETVK